MTDNAQIAAIYFPSWHDEPRRDKWLGEGFSEWDLIRSGRPRFDGHYQPQIPELGYLDETDPATMQRSCDLAASAGIDAFLWDWYWYAGEDFLNRPLNETFLSLPEPGVKFALMWANHDWVDVFPARVGKSPELWWRAAVSPEEFTRMTDIIIERYLLHPQYWRVQERAWFTIFRLDELVNGVGGLGPAREALADFRARARSAGAGELHLNIMGGFENYTPAELVELGVDTVGAYGWNDQWITTPPTETTFAYERWRAEGQKHWHTERARHSLDVIPTVAMGWDSSTRVSQDDQLEISVWPFSPVVTDNTPESFGAAVSDAIAFARENDTRVVVVNAWNEWTEGSYLEPDSRTGDGHLKALTAAVLASRAAATTGTE